MPRKTDRELGMDRAITRRDFIHDAGLAALGLGMAGPGLATLSETDGPAMADPGIYPPTRTGLRGSHPGSFEVAHAFTLGGKPWSGGKATGEHYDLVVVGAGISGLAAAYFYRRQHPDARILLLDNHDDFGGHARRNEFHQGGVMRLAWGGVFNLEYPSFSPTVNRLLDELGVDIDRLLANDDFRAGFNAPKGPAVWFDAETYGRDALVTGVSLRDADLDALAAKAAEFPLSPESRESLERFARARTDITAGMSEAEVDQLMHGISYTEFLVRHGGLTEEAAALWTKITDGYWAVPAHSLSVAECADAGLPMSHLLGEDPGSERDEYRAAMFPDGNASIARLLVRDLVPGVAPGKGMDDIVTARFDYSRLDRDDSPVRLRLESIVVHVANREGGGVEARYVKGGEVMTVTADQAVLACYHRIIPHLCPEMPPAQQEAQRYQVKRPLLLTNVLLRNSKAADALGIGGAYCPGRLHAATWLVRGISAEGYRHPLDDDGPVAMMFWGSPSAPQRGPDLKAQHRVSRAEMMARSFEDYEREVRTVLDGLLGPGGFEVKDDVLAITVNRWPHGYAYDYLDLWDPDWAPGQAPHEIARKRFGDIAIANADAGADAYTHIAIDQAWRAVEDLSS